MSTQAKTSLWRLALVCSTLILTSCGQKGALYHPMDTSHQPPATVQQDKPCKENDCKQQ